MLNIDLAAAVLELACPSNGQPAPHMIVLVSGNKVLIRSVKHKGYDYRPKIVGKCPVQFALNGPECVIETPTERLPSVKCVSDLRGDSISIIEIGTCPSGLHTHITLRIPKGHVSVIREIPEEAPQRRQASAFPVSFRVQGGPGRPDGVPFDLAELFGDGSEPGMSFFDFLELDQLMQRNRNAGGEQRQRPGQEGSKEAPTGTKTRRGHNTARPQVPAGAGNGRDNGYGQPNS